MNILVDINKNQSIMGRPRKELNEKDWLYAERLAAMMCTCSEIASVFGISEDTLQRRIKERYGTTFAVWADSFTGEVKIALRRAQLQSALDGNASMLQFLGRVYLEQNPTNNLNINSISKIDIRKGWVEDAREN